MTSTDRLVELQVWDYNSTDKRISFQVFFGSFCNSFLNSYFIEHLWVAAFDDNVYSESLRIELKR